MDAPDGRHSPEGDHHGDHSRCLWCHELVVFAGGRYVAVLVDGVKPEESK
jgi:hypothetical protein